MFNRHKTITLDITNNFVNEINDSKNEKHIMTTYIAIRDMQNDLITTTIFPKADASGVAYVEPLDGEDELSKNAVKNAMEKFGNHISFYYEVMRDMSYHWVCWSNWIIRIYWIIISSRKFFGINSFNSW